MRSSSTSVSVLPASAAAAHFPWRPVMEISLPCPWCCHSLCTGCASLICPKASLAPWVPASSLSPVSISTAFCYPQDTPTALFIFFPMSLIPHRGTSTQGHVLPRRDSPGAWMCAAVLVPAGPFGFRGYLPLLQKPHCDGQAREDGAAWPGHLRWLGRESKNKTSCK